MCQNSEKYMTSWKKRKNNSKERRERLRDKAGGPTEIHLGHIKIL